MIFEYSPSERVTLLEAFAEFADSRVDNGVVKLSDRIGSGYVKGVKLGGSLRMMLLDGLLKEELLFKRLASEQAPRHVTLTFQMDQFPSVRITSANIDYEISIPAGAPLRLVILSVNYEDLFALVGPDNEAGRLQRILTGRGPYFYEEDFPIAMQKVVDEMVSADMNSLSYLFYNAKSRELIYMLFLQLLSGGRGQTYPINGADVRTAYAVRDLILADLSLGPSLPALAQAVHISESKLKRLFKQVFGQTIYNYYQHYRMKRAAQLIREERLSVSEAGYRLGFSNLSHFTRVFHQHMSTNPKKYSALTHPANGPHEKSQVW
ncbi:helix-turn-helix transcriptional regulator [Pedobacter faecalis]|uniref:helix-turn-helix transcriptional regulator n=1 Tax=Pedobacter faecalis TaxID=3041495 RepID=UPI00254B8218|nr:helix-turn-helix domain-containing protein [Pedobacter sp. ELA7]